MFSICPCLWRIWFYCEKKVRFGIEIMWCFSFFCSLSRLLSLRLLLWFSLFYCLVKNNLPLVWAFQIVANDDRKKLEPLHLDLFVVLQWGGGKMAGKGGSWMQVVHENPTRTFIATNSNIQLLFMFLSYFSLFFLSFHCSFYYYYSLSICRIIGKFARCSG